MTLSWKLANWDDLISGHQCPVCDLIRLRKSEDEHMLLVGSLPSSHLYLAKNQFVKGYCVLICSQHVIEPYEMTGPQRAAYFNDLAVVGQALSRVFKADKMNYNMLGNIVPHLHTHILPRYFSDPAPNRPIDPGLKGHEVFLSEPEYSRRVREIWSAVNAILGAA